jgi:hypothetical protein
MFHSTPILSYFTWTDLTTRNILNFGIHANHLGRLSSSASPLSVSSLPEAVCF